VCLREACRVRGATKIQLAELPGDSHPALSRPEYGHDTPISSGPVGALQETVECQCSDEVGQWEFSKLIHPLTIEILDCSGVKIRIVLIWCIYSITTLNIRAVAFQFDFAKFAKF
jgi:hypothetical protein